MINLSKLIPKDFDSKPEIEKELFILQEKYLKERADYKQKLKTWTESDKSEEAPINTSTQYFAEMMSTITPYVRSKVLKRCKNKKFLEPEIISDYTSQATILFMSQYIKNENFLVDDSFAGMFDKKIMEAMYRKKDEDIHISLNYTNDDDCELMDMQGKFKMTNVLAVEMDENFTSKEDILNETIDSILSDIDELVDDERLKFITRLYLVILLSYPKNRHIKRLFIEKWSKEFKYEKYFERANLELYNRIRSY